MIRSTAKRAYAALESMGAAIFRRMDTMYSGVWSGPLRVLRSDVGLNSSWPVAPGAYVIGDPRAPVAVCTLTTSELVRPIAKLPGVAIAGRVYTCNLGIEKIVINVCANRHIRALLVCGRESPLFQPGQGLRALTARGIGADKQIVGAAGYLPVLGGIDVETVEQFRRQVVFVDRAGETDIEKLTDEVEQLARRFATADIDRDSDPVLPTRHDPPELDDHRFVELRPGGKREPLAYDPKGHFVITLARDVDRITAHHYTPDMSPGHVMRSRTGEGLVLALIREGLVTQLSHAAYLGAEFAKAETALRLHLEYEQDHPLRRHNPA